VTTTPSLPPRVLLLLVALTGGPGCVDSERVPQTVPEAPAPQDSRFESKADLLRAIESGTFAERADIEDEAEAPTALPSPPDVPDPVEIEFVRGTALPSDQRNELRELAAALTSDPRLTVTVVGCSDPPGSEAVNLRISRARAETVAAHLEELGVPAAQLGEVVGRGESCEVPERVVHVSAALRGGAERTAATSRRSPDS